MVPWGCSVGRWSPQEMIPGPKSNTWREGSPRSARVYECSVKDELRVCHPLILFPYSIHWFEVQGVLLRRKKKRLQYSLQMETKPKRRMPEGKR